jgi:mRNA-degrading endonuclease RelE of RelBE toxin-antitoxin system
MRTWPPAGRALRRTSSPSSTSPRPPPSRIPSFRVSAPDHRIELATRAVRDLRKLPRSDRERIREALSALAVDAGNLDVKALTGRAPWLRMRVGDWRVLYRPLLEDEAGGGSGLLVARVINRRELERAVRSLA